MQAWIAAQTRQCRVAHMVARSFLSKGLERLGQSDGGPWWCDDLVLGRLGRVHSNVLVLCCCLLSCRFLGVVFQILVSLGRRADDGFVRSFVVELQLARKECA